MAEESIRGKAKGFVEWLEHGYFLASVLIAAASGTTMRAILTAYTHLSPVWVTPIWLTVSAAAIGLLVLIGNLYQRRHSRISLSKPDESYDVFKRPPQEIVSDVQFSNQTVVLDGKRFYKCNFANVTWVFNGSAPTEFIDCTIGFAIDIKSDNPALKKYSELIRTLTANVGVKAFKMTGTDEKGNEIGPSTTVVQMTKAEQYVEINAPLTNGEVGLWRVVRGVVYPPNSEMQVLVHAGDNFWYLQGPPEVDGSSWSRACKFGLDKPGSGGDYRIVALLGKPVTESRIRELPANVPRSQEIRVRRTHDGDGAKVLPLAVPPHVIVLKIEHPERGMTPETDLILKNVGKEIVQNVGLRPLSISGKEVSFTQLALLAIDAEMPVSPRIKGVNALQQCDLLNVLESEWANTAVDKQEFVVRAALRFDDLTGRSFEVAFDLVYCARAHRIFKMSNNERTKRESILIEARNFGPATLLS